MSEGDKYFDKIWEGYGEENSGGNLNKAIEIYEKELNKSPDSVEAAWKLMKALYYLGTHFEESKKGKQKIFEKAISIGEKIYKTREGKSSAEVNLWMAINWGRLGESLEMFEAAKKGVADKIRKFAEESIKINPELDDGGGYKLLGRLYHKAPRIPIILSWPSTKKAVEFLEKAVKIAPDNISNRMFLAEALYAEGRKKKAVEILNEIVENAPADLNPEDKDMVERCQRLLKKWSK